jgi:hypothetical protein
MKPNEVKRYLIGDTAFYIERSDKGTIVKIKKVVKDRSE